MEKTIRTQNSILQFIIILTPTWILRLVAERQGRKLWRQVRSHSNAYAQALNLSEQQIESLYKEGGSIVVPTASHGIVRIFGKNTCVHDYGGTWQTVLQARTAHSPLKGIGQGTTFIAALSPEALDEVLHSISRGHEYHTQDHVWP